MKLNEINDPVKEFLEENDIVDYIINPDGTIDINRDVIIFTKQSKLPVKFRRVKGDFNCEGCNLTSLEGIPSYVGGSFYCHNNKLTSLHDIHKNIKELNGRIFYCYNNPIKDSVLGILLIKGIKKVYIDNDKVEKILNKYICQGRAGVIGAQQELLDAGLDEYAKL